jgi:hypothetical protein
MVDPTTVITTISAALKLVDQFREVALSVAGILPHPPSRTAEEVGDTLQVRKSDGTVEQEVRAEDVHLDQWDSVRMSSLQMRVTTNWKLYFDLYSQLPLLNGLQLAQTKVTMDNIKGALCTDFREMVRIYQAALGITLPDHYQLSEVCA